MSLFRFPIVNNKSVYLIPTIFFMFFCIFLLEKFDQSSKILKLFIYSILILSLLKFTRSKEFGTDIPVIALIFVGMHDMSTILIVILISFSPIAVSIAVGLSTLDPEYRHILLSLGDSRFEIFYNIIECRILFKIIIKNSRINTI